MANICCYIVISNYSSLLLTSRVDQDELLVIHDPNILHSIHIIDIGGNISPVQVETTISQDPRFYLAAWDVLLHRAQQLGAMFTLLA